MATSKVKAERNTPFEAPEKVPARYTVVADFQDRNGRHYRTGDTYIEMSDDRTKALLKAEKSDLNTIGKVFLRVGK